MPEKKYSNLDAYRLLSEKTKDDFDEALLKLSLLKERFEYRDAFKEFRALFNDKKQALTEQSLCERNMKEHAFYARFGIKHFSFLALVLAHKYKFKQILDMLDPSIGIDEVNQQLLVDLLPKLFYDRAVTVVEPLGGRDYNHPGPRARYRNFPDLAPHERLFRVDMSKPREQILRELTANVDAIFADKDWHERAFSCGLREEDCNDYQTWEADRTRKRKEAWKQLNIWRERRKRRPMGDIADRLGMTEDACRKAYYRAYELTQGRPYHYKDVRAIRLDELPRTCADCPHREACGKTGSLCPDALAYIEQDQTYLRESLTHTGDVDSLSEPTGWKRPPRSE